MWSLPDAASCCWGTCLPRVSGLLCGEYQHQEGQIGAETLPLLVPLLRRGCQQQPVGLGQAAAGRGNQQKPQEGIMVSAFGETLQQRERKVVLDLGRASPANLASPGQLCATGKC